MRWAAALLIVAMLAGCADEAVPEPVEEGPGLITDPSDYTYVGNAALDNGGHIHDYWGGLDRLTVVDTVDQGIVGLFGLPNVTAHVIRPEDGVVIPQGTSQVDITLGWANAPADQYSQVELWIQTAADNVPRKVSEVENGDTVTLMTEHADNDLPHQLLSAWQFHVVVYQGSAGIGRWQAETTLVAEAVRGLDIPVFPAHPDQWAERGQDGRILLIDEERSTFYQTQDPFLQSCSGGGCMYFPYDLDDGAIVPLDAEHVWVELTWTATAPSSLALMVHAADTREWSFPEAAEDGEGRRVYQIPVSGVMGDGPYALQSLWEFNVYIDDPSMVYSGAYTLTAEAVAASTI